MFQENDLVTYKGREARVTAVKGTMLFPRYALRFTDSQTPRSVTVAAEKITDAVSTPQPPATAFVVMEPQPVAKTLVVDYARGCVVQTIPFENFRRGKPLPETIALMEGLGYMVEVIK